MSGLVSFDDDKVVEQKLNYLKASKDEYIRIHIPQIDKILCYSQHYSKAEGAGFIRCLKDRDEECPMCQSTSDSIRKFKLNVLVYQNVNEDGSVPEDTSTVVVIPKVMKFGIKMFSALRAKHKKFKAQGGLSSIDIVLHCTNDQFQHFDVEDDSQCLAKIDKRIASLVEAQVQKFVDFETYKDRDVKFPTPMEMKKWIELETGVKQKTPDLPIEQIVKEVQDTEAPVNEEAKKLMDDLV